MWTQTGEAYVSKPERVAQAFLGLFLQGHWTGLAFVGKEIDNGDGFIDLLVNFLGVDYVVELKMLGGGYGIGHAKGGLDQLDAYMQNFQHQEAYLVVFDGRKTQQGEQLQPAYDLPHGRAPGRDRPGVLRRALGVRSIAAGTASNRGARAR